MGFLSGIGKAVHSPDFGMRLQAALAAAGGDQNAIYHMREMQRQNAELQLRQQAAQRAEQDRADQVWGAKESGVGNPLIAGMNPDDLSRTLRERVAPHSEAPGTRYTTPSLNGGADTASTNPTMDEQTQAWLASQPNSGAALAQAYAEKQAYPAPMAIQQGGGAVGFGPTGPHYLVQPDGMAPQPTPGAPPQPGGRQDSSAFDFRRNPAAPPASAPRYADPMGFQGGRMTSGRRTPQGNAAVGGVPGSAHLRGDAADFVPLPGQTLQQTLNAARQYFPNGNASIHRGTHVHESQPGYGQTPFFGARGAAGAPRGNGQAAALRAEAQRAIAAGADPAAVTARLRQMGVN